MYCPLVQDDSMTICEDDIFGMNLCGEAKSHIPKRCKIHMSTLVCFCGTSSFPLVLWKFSVPFFLEVFSVVSMQFLFWVTLLCFPLQVFRHNCIKAWNMGIHGSYMKGFVKKKPWNETVLSVSVATKWTEQTELYLNTNLSSTFVLKFKAFFVHDFFDPFLIEA